MEEKQPKPVIKKPPVYKDPNTPSKPALKPPPQLVVLPPSFYQKRRRRRCCRTFCCCFCILIFVFMLLLLVLSSLFYLWFDPKLPVFRLQTLKISNFSVARKLDGSFLNASTIGKLEVSNPNSKLPLHYGVSKVDITVGKDQEIELGSTAIPAFTQKAETKLGLKIETSVSQELVGDSLGSKLQTQFKNRNLIVNVDMKTSMGLSGQGIKLMASDVHVTCEGLTLKQLDGGVAIKCGINLLRWINVR